jgi:predicted phosphodiesterase
MKTLVVPDVHVPFHCRKAEKLLHKLIRSHKPQKIVFLGDVADIHALTTHPKITHWRDNLEDELYQTHEYLAKVRRTAGDKTKIIYIRGNHEFRWERMVDKCVPHMSVTRNMLPYFLGLKELDIKWVRDAGRTPVRTTTGQGKVRFLHGHEVKGGSAFPCRHALKIGKLLGESVHIGHTHRFGTMGFTTPKGTHFAIEGGFVADKDSDGMQYAYPQTDWLRAYALYDDKDKTSPLPTFYWV